MRPVRLVARERRVHLAVDNLEHALITVRLWGTGFPEICIAKLTVTGERSYICLGFFVGAHQGSPSGHACDIVRIDHVVIGIPGLPGCLFELIIVPRTCTGSADVVAVFLQGFAT